jgi:hypothetical protein
MQEKGRFFNLKQADRAIPDYIYVFVNARVTRSTLFIVSIQFFYSYLNASIGSSREAFCAG